MTVALPHRGRQAWSASARGFALCSSAMITLGASFPINQLLLGYPTSLSQALRYGLAALVLIYIAALSGRALLRGIRAEQWLRLALVGGSLVPFNLLLFESLRRADPAVVATVLGCAPIGMAVCGPLLRGRAPAVRLLAAAGIVAAGTAVVHGGGRTDTVGVLCAAGALVADMAFTIWAAGLMAELDAVAVAAGSSMAAVPLFVATALVSGEVSSWRLPTAAQGAAIGFLAVVLTAVAFVWWFRGVDEIGVDHAGITISWVPVATVATAAVQHGAWPQPSEVLGVAVVAAGLVMGLAPPKRRRGFGPQASL
ncbi:DMT family transporter [Catellatospora sp. NPDC049133]|uniref:DMT family transporter n=1 Tax=Catellatospora sp. NPDC049133 TaxID=3155499 RepID=UPI0033D5F2C5